MARLRRIGLTGLAVIFMAGVWLCVAPWATGQQPRGAPWTPATSNDVWLGAALTVAGLTGFFTALAGRVHELYGDAEHIRG